VKQDEVKCTSEVKMERRSRILQDQALTFLLLTLHQQQQQALPTQQIICFNTNHHVAAAMDPTCSQAKMIYNTNNQQSKMLEPQEQDRLYSCRFYLQRPSWQLVPALNCGQAQDPIPPLKEEQKAQHHLHDPGAHQAQMW